MEKEEALDSLLAAIVSGDLGLTKAIIEQDNQLIHKAKWYLRPLHFAVRENHFNLVEYLLSEGANPSPSEELAVAPPTLEIARLHNYKNIVLQLEQALNSKFNYTQNGELLARELKVNKFGNLEAKIKEEPSLVNEADEQGNRPIHWAVLHNNKRAIETLLENGAQIDPQRADGKTPIHLTLYKHDWWMNRFKDQNLDLLNFLLEKGAEYSIILASAIGDTEKVNTLLKQDPTLVNFQDSINKRPLSCASEAGHLDTVELLLSYGADPNASEALCDRDGGYSLYGAVWGNHLEIVELLLNHGANPNTEVDSSGNPLSAAKGKPEIENLLLKHNAKPIDCLAVPPYIDESSLETIDKWFKANQDKIDNTLYVHHGEGEEHQNQQCAILSLAFKNGANPDKCPLYVLSHALTKLPIVARCLLDNGVSANLQCKMTGTTILHKLADSGEIEAMKLLLEYKPSLDLKDFVYKSTALAWAIKSGNQKMVEFLLKAGASVTLEDDTPTTSAVYWAQKIKNKEIIELLNHYNHEQ